MKVLTGLRYILFGGIPASLGGFLDVNASLYIQIAILAVP
jgi:hypothetical protein